MSNIVIGKKIAKFRVEKPGEAEAKKEAAAPVVRQDPEETYAPLGKSEALLAMAAMHHRLLWIHPFIDGNGRVARLMSHAQLLNLLDTGGVWSISLTAKNRKLVASMKPGLDNLAFDSRGRLFVSSMTDNGIYLVDKQTGAWKTIVEGRLATPSDLAVVSDASPRQVPVLRPQPHGDIESRRILHGVIQHLMISQRYVRVRKSDAARLAQLRHFGKTHAL